LSANCSKQHINWIRSSQPFILAQYQPKDLLLDAIVRVLAVKVPAPRGCLTGSIKRLRYCRIERVVFAARSQARHFDQTNRQDTTCKGTIAIAQTKKAVYFTSPAGSNKIRLDKQKELCIMSRAPASGPRREGKGRRVSITTIQS
jgi:hypothetical protein